MQKRISSISIFFLLALFLAQGCTPKIYTSEENVTIPVKSKNGKTKYFPKNSKWIGFESDFDIDPKELTQFPNIESLELTCHCIQSLDNFPVLPNLKYLNLSGTKIKSLRQLQKMKNIDVLHLSKTEITSLEEIYSLKKMIWLRLDHTKIEDIQFVKYFPELRRLDIRHTQVANLNSIKSVKKLNELRISYTRINDITKLIGLQHLVFVEVENLTIPDEQILEVKLANPYIKIIKKTL